MQAAAGVRIRWLPASERESAGRIWRDLEAGLQQDSLASSWDWTDAWLAHYGDVVRHRFAIAEVDDAARGIVLVTEGSNRRRGPFRLRTVHLGTAGEPPGEGVLVEYNRVLVEPDHRRAFAAALIGEIRGGPTWHELHLDGFAPEDAEPFLDVEPLLVPRIAASRVVDLREAAAQDGSVLQVLKRATRTKVRRSLKGLGAVEGEWADTPETAFDVLDELIGLHERRWQRVGEPGAFARPRFARFHRELIRRLLPQGRVVLFRVRSASGTVGCLYGFIERRRLLFYQSGLASYSDRQIRPGFVVCHACMQACFDRGLTEFDFLAGESSYKSQLSTTTRELVWATARQPALRWTAMDKAAAARRRLRPNMRPSESR
jgi:CelD/BcsL family acetyltransferase involved in cellulose biosynthesis